MTSIPDFLDRGLRSAEDWPDRLDGDENEPDRKLDFEYDEYELELESKGDDERDDADDDDEVDRLDRDEEDPLSEKSLSIDVPRLPRRPGSLT